MKMCLRTSNFSGHTFTDQPSPGVNLTSTSDQKPSTGTADQEPSISIADLQSNASQLLSESHQLKTVSHFEVRPLSKALTQDI